MSRAALPEEAGLLLRALFPDDVMTGTLRINLRGLVHGGAPDDAVSRFVPSVATLQSDGYAGELLAWNDDQDRSVYVAPGIRRGPEGKKVGVVALTALYADLDAKDFLGLTGRLTPAQRTEGKRLARQRLRERLPTALQPSFVIDSGGGLQAWWLFKEPAWIGGDHYAIETLEGYLKGLAQALGGDPAVAQVAALMRVPGYVNRKYPDAPLATILEADSTRRFNPSDFDDFFLAIPPSEPRSASEPGALGPLAPVLTTCGFLQWCREHPADVREPLWYALCSNLVRLEGGRAAAHAFSRSHPGYSAAETDQKLDQALAASGPITCTKIQELGFTGCPPDGHGVKSPAGLAWTRPAEPARPQAPLLIRASLADILALPPATLQTTYVVAPYVPENGLVAISAKPGVGKTKLILDLCLARATGGPWLGLSVAPGPALFWSGEQGWKEDYRNVQALGRGRQLATAAPHFFDVLSDPALKFGHPTMLGIVLALATAHAGLLIGVDSMRRAFEGEDISSDVADHFFRTVLLPLRAAGATVVLLAHPPKTSGTQRAIPDENMLRGSGDFAGQIDGFFVLRPVARKRADPDTEDVITRLTHPKGRRGWVADPQRVTLHVTHDRDPAVTFLFEAAAAPVDAAQETAGALRAAALLAEELHRVSRKTLVDTLATRDPHYGRPTVEAALATLVGLGVLRGPLPPEARRPGERGHWYVFVKPIPDPDPPAEDADDEDVPF